MNTNKQKNVEHPKAFISYSWTNEEHEEWVLDLANRLTEDGIKVVLDKWDLKGGQDKYDFMEQMVESEDIDKVLLICDKGYKNKADNREGGVGTETQIITPEIYNNVKQEKFIPVIAEKDENEDPYIPSFIKTRKYFDLSSGEYYEEEYEKLLRNLWEKPLHQKPSLGQPPSYLDEREIDHYKTANIIKRLKNTLKKRPEQKKGVAIDFINSFEKIVKEFRILDFDTDEPDDEVVKKAIEELKPLRNDYIKFIETQCGMSAKVEVEQLIKLFEDLYPLTQPAYDKVSSFKDYWWDHIKFLIREMILFTVAVLIEYEQYNQLATFLHTEFFVKDPNRPKELKEGGFELYNFTFFAFDRIRKKRLDSRKISQTAQLFVQRADFKRYNKRTITSSDMLLYYLSDMLGNKHSAWFPLTYVYTTNRKVEILQKLKSKRHFEKMKKIFGVESAEELAEKINSLCHPHQKGYRRSLESVPPIEEHINPEDICTVS